jgi:hypothetical protein
MLDSISTVCKKKRAYPSREYKSMEVRTPPVLRQERILLYLFYNADGFSI